MLFVKIYHFFIPVIDDFVDFTEVLLRRLIFRDRIDRLNVFDYLRDLEFRHLRITVA